MSLIDRVAIEPRFQRAVRIDSDLGDAEALRGFICPPSSVAILRSMAEHVADTGQAAFTWTGPYGSGKSSLVIALSALMNGHAGLREEAAGIIGREAAEDIWSKLPPKKKGWRILGIVGRKDDPVTVIGEAIVRSGLAPAREAWTETAIIEILTAAASEKPEKHGGLIVFVDEMGKMLEAAARGHGDVHLLQQVAELASRSGGRLLFVGILHQAFDEYAAKLSRDLRDEWTKIHGRFVDLPVNVGAEEQIAILSRAVNGSPSDDSHTSAATAVAASISSGRPEFVKSLADLLAGCWPLHSATAALLGPISRRRFGQNQRSIFGFLNSAEPFGFREFLRTASEGMFTPDRLWDYLRVNLEPAILSSPDGHRWAVAAEGIDRCAAMGGDELHLRLLKTIAVIDLFRERSGLVGTHLDLQLVDAGTGYVTPPDFGIELVVRHLHEPEPLEQWLDARCRQGNVVAEKLPDERQQRFRDLTRQVLVCVLHRRVHYLAKGDLADYQIRRRAFVRALGEAPVIDEIHRLGRFLRDVEVCSLRRIPEACCIYDADLLVPDTLHRLERLHDDPQASLLALVEQGPEFSI